MPAPYPGYAIVLYSIFAHAPYPLAKALWLALIASALVGSAFAMAKLSEFPVVTILIALVPTGILTNLQLGAAPPLALAGLCLAALAYRSGRPRLAVLPLGLAMINPHLILPSAIALFIVAPSARVVMIAAATVLATLSIAAIGFSANLDYVRSVLPAHAAAEVFHHYQYSLTHMLTLFGISPAIALKIGSFSYVVLAIVGIALAVRQRTERFGSVNVILLPTAIVALGGTFIHAQDIILALPAAFVFCRTANTAESRVTASIAIIGLLFGLFAEDLRIGSLTYVAACAGVGAFLWKPHTLYGAIAMGCAAVMVLFGISALHIFAIPANELHFAATLPVEPFPILATSDSSDVWGTLLSLSPRFTYEDASTIGLKVPTWIGLGALLVFALRSRVSVAEKLVLTTPSSCPPRSAA